MILKRLHPRGDPPKKLLSHHRYGVWRSSPDRSEKSNALQLAAFADNKRYF
jgi:hypothetical protein